MNDIPVVDLENPAFAEQVLEAWRRIGFVAVAGHGVSSEQIREMRELLERLFSLGARAKAAVTISRDDYRGFIPLGFFTPNRPGSSGAATDLYEGFKLHWECPEGHPVMDECALYGRNRWPRELPEMRRIVLDYWARCDDLAAQLLDVAAPALGVERNTLRSWHDAPLTNMTLLHYPATDDPAVGIHPHKDTNVITLLHPDPGGGLEVRRSDGTWLEVTCPPDAMLVNTGEMLELWSGGEMMATPHRVVNTTGRARYSFPYFVVPRHDITVEPLGSSRDGYSRPPMPVGELSAEVWRTNWPDEFASNQGHDLGTLDR